MTSSLTLFVAVATKIDKLLAYSVDDLGELPQKISSGALVRVPLGRRLETGVVTNTESSLPRDLEGVKLKSVQYLFPRSYWLDPSMLQLADWMSVYYHQTLNRVYQTMLPGALTGPNTPSFKPETGWLAEPLDSPEQLNRSPKQRELHAWLEHHPKSTTRQILEAGFNRDIVHKLQQKKLLARQEIYLEASTDRENWPTPAVKKSEIHPTREQKIALQRFRTLCSQHPPKPSLLHGVTGSGKTEIYKQTTEDVLQQGMQVLVLIPEIGLVDQTLRSFSARFDTRIYVYTSDSTDTEKKLAWQAATIGHPTIFIGTRSAIFLPLSRLGLIVLDEEHDLSYKQQEGFRYNARDLAVVRAASLQIPIILGTATPSLESFKNLADQNYELLQLTERVHQGAVPEIRLHKIEKQQILSTPSVDKIRAQLSAGSQVLVFVNRRGYAPRTSCQNCGWVALCPNCDSALCRHLRPARLICHHCEFQQPNPTSCPSCFSSDLIHQGIGTEQLELQLQRLFPQIDCIRIDRDSTSRKGAFKNHIDQAKNAAACILIGTQMLAKGHHLPKLSLAIICDADQALFSHDFRALEHLGQLVTQVAGRTGRGQTVGELVVETDHPEHPIWEQLSDDYGNFARKLSADRKARQLPPYSYAAILRAECADLRKLLQFLDQARSICERHNHGNDIVGPIPAVIEKKLNRHRYQIQFTGATRKQLHRTLYLVIESLKNLKQQSQVRWNIDVDPQTLD